jgi:hypothetical protein
MKFKVIFTIGLFLFLSVLSDVSFSQIKADLEDYYQASGGKTAKENLDANVEPLLELFGFYTGGGMYNTAKTHSILGVDVGVKAIMMVISDDAKTDWAGAGGVKGGPLGDYKAVPLPVFQAGVGLGSSLELMGRFFSAPIAESNGKKENITLLGVGLKYGVIQSMVLPRVSLIAAYHKLSVPVEYDFGDVSSISLDLVVSKGIPFLATFYGGIGIDKSNMTVKIKQISESFDYSASQFRGVVGVKFDFIPLAYANVDYNFGAHQGLTLGLGLSLR